MKVFAIVGLLSLTFAATSHAGIYARTNSSTSRSTPKASRPMQYAGGFETVLKREYRQAASLPKTPERADQ